MGVEHHLPLPGQPLPRTDLLPATAAERARVEQWMDWQATEFNNAWRYAFMARVRQSPQHQDPHAIAAATARTLEGLPIRRAMSL